MKKFFLLYLIVFPFTEGLFAGTPKKPNIVFILVDDLGISDLGFTGSKFYESPNIDKLSKEGKVFTQAYTSGSVCSPTRAAIMTGKNPARLKITNWIPGGPRSYPFIKKLKTVKPEQFLPENEWTIAEALKSEGYVTGIIGKWHLGGEGKLPEQNGFSVNVAGGHEGRPRSYFSPYRLRNLHTKKKGEYLTDRLTDESIKFVKENKNKNFFLYLSFYTVHTPIQGKKKDIKYFNKKRKSLRLPKLVISIKEGKRGKTRKFQNNSSYASMIRIMDYNVGRLMKTLKENNLEENTIVIFTSDNGGFSTYHKLLYPFYNPATSNAPFRAGKGYPYEGGIRTPLIIKWKNKIKMGSKSDIPVISADLYPTILNLAGVQTPLTQKVDGKNLSPILKEKTSIDRIGLYWHFPHYHIHGVPPYTAVRVGKFKLIYWYESKSYELYNLAKDPSEKNNLSREFPKKVLELAEFMKAKNIEMNSFIPKRR